MEKKNEITYLKLDLVSLEYIHEKYTAQKEKLEFILNDTEHAIEKIKTKIKILEAGGADNEITT